MNGEKENDNIILYLIINKDFKKAVNEYKEKENILVENLIKEMTLLYKKIYGTKK